MKNESETRALVYTCTKLDKGAKGMVTIHALPETHGELVAWLEKLPVDLEYRGEGLPNLTHKVLLELLRRRDRRYLTGEEKAELLEQYNYSCAMCGEQTSCIEWDHIAPLSQCLGPQEMQPLCITRV